MLAESAKFRGHRCFKNHWSGFDTFKFLNVIVGRNNTGKSHLLDLPAALCGGQLPANDWEYKFSGVLDEASLKQEFRPDVHGGALNGRWWFDHGQIFANVPITWEFSRSKQIELSFPPGFQFESKWGFGSTQARLECLRSILSRVVTRFTGTKFCRLAADRDISPEPENNALRLDANGSGATNIIRRFILTTNPAFPREVIQVDMLNALNDVFAGDGQFNEIQVKVHDEPGSGFPQGHWEVFLGEKKKGDLHKPCDWLACRIFGYGNSNLQ